MRPSSSPSEPPAAGLFDAVLARGPVRGLVSDAAWLQAMLDAEAALARAEAAVGLFPTAYAEAIAAACHADRYDVTRLGSEAADSGNPVIPLVRALTGIVQAAAGDDAAGWVHFGATSQDVLDTATSLVAGRAGIAIADDLRQAGDAAARLARDHATTVMAGRTLLQQATPTTFGLAAATWLDGLDRATDELRSAVAAPPGATRWRDGDARLARAGRCRGAGRVRPAARSRRARPVLAHCARADRAARYQPRHRLRCDREGRR